MTLDYLHDFIRLYYIKCGQYKTKKEAYEACEDAYALQYKLEISSGLMKETRFSGFDSFCVSLNRFLKDPKNRARIDI